MTESADSAGTAQIVRVAAGESAPADGYWSPYPPLAVTADLVVLAVAPRPEGYAGRLPESERALARRDGLLVATVRRADEPYRGRPALPGGFLRHAYPGGSGATDATLRDAATRELLEESGLASGVTIHSQVGAFGDADRDPRLRVVTVAYLATMRTAALLRPGGDATAAEWLPVRGLLDGRPEPLAFDHVTVLATALSRLQALVEDTQAAMDLVGESFTIPDLHWAYETVFDQALDPGNFHRKVTRGGFVEPAEPDEVARSVPLSGGLVSDARSGPAPAPGRARLYVPGPEARLYPPIRAGRSG